MIKNFEKSSRIKLEIFKSEFLFYYEYHLRQVYTHTSIFSVGALSMMSGSIFAFLNSDSTFRFHDSPNEKPIAQRRIPKLSWKKKIKIKKRDKLSPSNHFFIETEMTFMIFSTLHN